MAVIAVIVVAEYRQYPIRCGKGGENWYERIHLIGIRIDKVARIDNEVGLLRPYLVHHLCDKSSVIPVCTYMKIR